MRKKHGITMNQHIELIAVIPYVVCMAYSTLMFGSFVWTQGSQQELSFTKCSSNGFPLRCYSQELVLKPCSDIL